MRFTGFDSAWGGRQKGAVCDLELNKDVLSITRPPVTVSWPDAIQLAQFYCESAHIIAIDQGLVVPNATSMRPVERLLASALMSTYGCGAHASNCSNTPCYGPEAGIWKYLDQIEAIGFEHNPMAVPRSTSGKYYFECFPHPAILGIFGEPQILKYKVKKRVSEDWNRLLELIAGLSNAELPVRNVKDFFPPTLTQTKANEDLVDAFIAAYSAAYWWKYGTDKSICIGSLTTGYMVTPCTKAMRDLLQKKFAATETNAIGTAARSVPIQSDVPQAEVHESARQPARIESPPLIPQGEWHGPVPLSVNDPGCIWLRRNSWMNQELTRSHLLNLHFFEIDREPQLSFAPFNVGDSGMKPFDDDTRLEWHFLAAGTSNDNVETYQVYYQYTPA